MIFDTKVPSTLKNTQIWFASIITRPIDIENRMELISPSGASMVQEAVKYINASPTMQPYERIELYNQQYWWRLLSNLQENYPLVTRLFGYLDFNQSIAFPYLVKYPSSHWSLNYLGEHLMRWIDEEYDASDKLLVKHAAEVDLAINTSFFANRYEPLRTVNLSPEETETLSEKTLCLEPHVKLLTMPYQLLKFREEMMLQDPDYWTENPFPILEHDKGIYAFAIYRNRKDHVVWDCITPTVFKILELFKKGTNIENVCEWIELQTEETVTEATTNLHLWFQEWTLKEWLYIKG